MAYHFKETLTIKKKIQSLILHATILTIKMVHLSVTKIQVPEKIVLTRKTFIIRIFFDSLRMFLF